MDFPIDLPNNPSNKNNSIYLIILKNKNYDQSNVYKP